LIVDWSEEIPPHSTEVSQDSNTTSRIQERAPYLWHIIIIVAFTLANQIRKPIVTVVIRSIAVGVCKPSVTYSRSFPIGWLKYGCPVVLVDSRKWPIKIPEKFEMKIIEVDTF